MSNICAAFAKENEKKPGSYKEKKGRYWRLSWNNYLTGRNFWVRTSHPESGKKKNRVRHGTRKNIEKDKTGKKRRMEEIKWQRKFIEMETRKEERRKGGWSKIK